MSFEMAHEHVMSLYCHSVSAFLSLTCSVVNNVLSEHQQLPLTAALHSCALLSHPSLCCSSCQPLLLSPAGRPDVQEHWPELPLCWLLTAGTSWLPICCWPAKSGISGAMASGLQALLFFSLGSLYLSDLFCVRFV